MVGKTAHQQRNCVDQISELFAFPGKLSRETTLPDYKVRILVKNCRKDDESVKFQPKLSPMNPLSGDGVYGKVISRMTSQHLSLIRIWLVQTFCIFLIGWNRFGSVQSPYRAQVSKQRWLPRNLFRSVLSLKIFRWQLLVFKSQMPCTYFQSFNWREVFSLAYRSGCLL